MRVHVRIRIRGTEAGKDGERSECHSNRRGWLARRKRHNQGKEERKGKEDGND